MTAHPPISALATEPDWLVFAKALAAAMENPSDHGFSDSSRLLSHVAQERGVDPASLRNHLAAVSWMSAHAPEALHKKNPGFPMTGVLVLSQIHKVSRELAADLAPEFFSGGVTKAELQHALRQAQAEKGGRGVPGQERIRRTARFEDDLYRYLAQHPLVLNMGKNVEVRRTEQSGRIPCDLIIMRDGKEVAAIEAKAPRQKRHHRYLLETIAMASLLSREYPSAVLVVPESWGDAVDEMADLIKALKFEDLKLAVFSDHDDQDESKTRFRYAL